MAINHSSLGTNSHKIKLFETGSFFVCEQELHTLAFVFSQCEPVPTVKWNPSLVKVHFTGSRLNCRQP